MVLFFHNASGNDQLARLMIIVRLWAYRQSPGAITRESWWNGCHCIRLALAMDPMC